MKRITVMLALWLFAVQAWASVTTFQVTIGAGTTQVSTTSVTCRWMVIQNNATHAIHIGDSATSSSKGIQLLSGGGSFYQGFLPNAVASDLKTWYINGTQNDVIDVVCDVIPQ